VALLLTGLPLPANGQAEDAPPPLTPIGAVPIEVMIDVAFDVCESIAGAGSHAIQGAWNHIATDGADALVIYAPPREFEYWYPGSPDDCQDVDAVPAHQRA